jgi:glucose-1-phosphate cytidylyltransferase
MKVILFCGGEGIKLNEYADTIPKPMVPVGYRPILWHIMKYYAHFGHNDFILCLGNQGDVIKDYFVNYNEYISNDFMLKAGSKIDLLSRDIDDWKITFVDTGANANLSERLLAVKDYVAGEEIFLVNYSDSLTDLDLNVMLDRFDKNKMVGMLLAVKPPRSFNIASINAHGKVTGLASLNKMDDVWVNGGYFVFTQEIFRHIDPSENLTEKTFSRLIQEGLLSAHAHDGTFLTIDSYKEKQMLDDMWAKGDTPWQVWKKKNGAGKKGPTPISNRLGRTEGLVYLLKLAILNLELLTI